MLLVKDDPLQKIIWKDCRITCYKEQKQCLERNWAIHPPTCQCIPSQITIYQNLPKDIHKISAPPWPAQSPHFNIIENVLLRVKNHMNPDARSSPRSKQQLIARVFKEWRKIPAFFDLMHLFQSDVRLLLQQEATPQNVDLV